MDISFLSSGAISREHYNLVQSVESAQTSQQVDYVLLSKIDVVRRRFEKSRPTSYECVHSLILLLYCWTATNLGQVTRAALYFALPHAATLAEAGNTLKEKRTGYLFCQEIMDQSDELQLMLVNTLRKDLEHLSPPRICLALDVLLLNCSAEAIPAVTSRVLDLLAHDCPHVKKKALAVMRNISRQAPEILINAHEKVMLRIKGPDLYVSNAAARLLVELTQASVITPVDAMHIILSQIRHVQVRGSEARKPPVLYIKLIKELYVEFFTTELSSDIITAIVDMLLQTIQEATDSDHVLISECFRAISRLPTQYLTPIFASSKPLSLLSRLLDSPKPNVQYLCITCLLELDAVLWAGSGKDIPPAFSENQVSIIMGFLDSLDSIIRIRTLQLLSRVDKGILLMHLTQLISALPSTSEEEAPLAERALEVSAVYEQHGKAYAGRLLEICVRMNHQGRSRGKHITSSSGAKFVSENVVEQVLLHLRRSSDLFCGEFVDGVIRIPASDAGPTLTLIIAASVCEYGAMSAISQRDILRCLSERLVNSSPAIQEALLLTMLRVTARSNSASSEVSNQVRILHGVSRSHIRRRCEQYLRLSDQMSTLHKIVENTKSDTLPDFLLALETAELGPHDMSSAPDRSPIVSDSGSGRKSLSPGARGVLRYEAYEPPRPARKLARRRSSATSIDSHVTNSHSGHSGSSSSSHRRSREYDAKLENDADSDDGLSRTLTAGDLALAAHEPNFAESRQTITTHHREQRPDAIEDLIFKSDLITLDSPFPIEHSQSPVFKTKHVDPPDFNMVWDVLKAHSSSRGWCERNVEEVSQRLLAMTTHQAILLSPAIQLRQGLLELVVSSWNWDHSSLTEEAGLLAAIRLRAGEEGSTLWQMRCLDTILKGDLKKILDD
ncbi:ARM repeat-containing protein [Ramaria rubella]|nr:ARM repeat-containing protein [Ramaria rubella]